MDLTDPLTLARLQFAFTVSFHFLFPAFTIGLASYLAVLEGALALDPRRRLPPALPVLAEDLRRCLRHGRRRGIVMSYQFGTNWSRLSDIAGNVMGPVLSYEVMTAFFLEAGFLGIMLFGWKRVGEKLHFFATCMVALGTAISAFWILSTNSWMHTPAGYAIVDGRFKPGRLVADRLQSFVPLPLRAHRCSRAYLTTAFVVGGVGAWHLLRGHWDAPSRRMFSMAMWMATIVAPIQAVVGDFHGLNTLHYQPAKIAAMEGHFESQRGAPLYPLRPARHGGRGNPLRHRDPQAGQPDPRPLLGRRDQGPEGLPARPVAATRRCCSGRFRLMVGIGLAMIAIGLVSLWLRWHGQLYDARWFLRLCVAGLAPGLLRRHRSAGSPPSIGRQPWVIYGLLRTADAVSPDPAAGSVATSLVAVRPRLLRRVRHRHLLPAPPDADGATEAAPDATEPGGQRPIAAADEPLDEPRPSAPSPAE